MDLLNGELGFSDDMRVTSTIDGHELIGTEAERVSDISELADKETTIPKIKTEPNEQTASIYKKKKGVCFEAPIITSEPMSLSDLPDEMLLHILSYFGPDDLFLIAKVSDRMNVLSKDAFRKTLSYSCDRSSDISHIKKVLTNAPALHSLIIHERNDAARILEFRFRHRGYLRKLILKRCSLGDDSTGLLANIVALFPDLESLSLERCHPLTSTGCCLIPRLKKLSELNLSFCQELSGETLRLIADSCQNLKKLNLDGVSQNDDDIIHVIDRLGKQLTTLVLEGYYLTDDTFSYLKNCPRCVRLEELTFHECHDITDEGMSMVIRHCNQLRVLDLWGLHYITGGFLELVPSHLPHLRRLRLGYCHSLCDTYVEELLAAVPELKVTK